MKGYLNFITIFLLVSILPTQAQERIFREESQVYEVRSDSLFDPSGGDEESSLEYLFPPPEKVDLSSVEPISKEEFWASTGDKSHLYPSPIEMLALAKQLEIEVRVPKIQITQSSLQNPNKISAAISFGRLLSVTLMALHNGNDHYLKNGFLLLKKGSISLGLGQNIQLKLGQIENLLASGKMDRTHFTFEILELSELIQKQEMDGLSAEKRVLNDIISLSVWLQAVDLISEGPLDPDQLSGLKEVIGVPHIYDGMVEKLRYYDDKGIENHRDLDKLKLYMNRLRAFFTRRKLTENLLLKAKAILKIYLP